ncbi:hypothetical protein B0011_06175 [Salmonella enterica subsp. diarizonae serovar 48:i:z]|nr:hypothetical protein [Salmonella enterica subsp. diarizonae serovar 48:i:z]
MNIDKQALLGADKHANQHRLSRLIIEANSAELRDIAEAVEQYTDQLIAALADSEKHIAELESKNGYLRTIAHEQNELAIRANLDSINDAAEMDGLHKRIAELENSETQLINERDHAESALADMYFAATGDRPEWSNCFSFSDAVDAVVDRIADLEAKQPSPVVLDSGPVVPEECPADISVLMASHSDALFNDDDAQEIWNACRAVMLQGFRDLSQPVDPQVAEYEQIMLRAGWVMVPVEPTDEMIAAAMECEDVLFNSDGSFCVQFREIYCAMVDAAPKPETMNG